jgi:GNAT superfamily N-acetyltransferase
MRAAGYLAAPTMVMLLEDPPQAPPPDAVRQVGADEMRALQERLTADDGEIPDRDRPGVLDGMAHLFASVPGTRCYHGLLDGEHVCEVVLYQDGRTGQPEQVQTLSAARGRGIAGAAVARATLDAVEAGCDLVFLVCNAATGPYPLYAELGYRAAGRYWAFTRPG